VSPDTATTVPPQEKKKTGSHTTSYKDTLNNHTNNKDGQDWDVSPYDDASYATAETLPSLQRSQPLSDNILKPKQGQNKENVLTCSSSDSSSSDVTDNTNELIEAMQKHKNTLAQEDAAPHKLSNNKPPPAEADPSKSSLKGDQTTTTTRKDPPLPISEDTNTFMSNTSPPAKEYRMDSYLVEETPTHIPSTNKSPPIRESLIDPPLEDTVMTATIERKSTTHGTFNSDNRYSIYLLNHYHKLWTLKSAINNGCSELKPRGPKII
jgi:hypothetical protein